MRNVRVAMIQMHVVPGELAQNLRHAAALVRDASAKGAEVVVLPECMDVGWCDPSAAMLAGTIPGGTTHRALTELAREHEIYVCSGLTERAGERVFNSAVLIAPTGELLLQHRKLNELELAHDLYAQGDRLGVVDTPLGRIGIMICADATARGGVVTRALAYMGADFVLSPTAWAVPPDHDNTREPYGDMWRGAYGPVCIDHAMYILGVSNVGPVRGGAWAGWKCIGCSLAIGPDGTELVQGPYGEAAEATLHLEIQPRPRPARGNGWFSYWNDPLKHEP